MKTTLFYLFVILILLTGLSGCQKKSIEIRHKPAMQIPGTWSTVQVDDSEIIKQWWNSFQDPTLDELIGRGLAKNYNLQSASARIEAAIEQVKIIGADSLPQVSAGFNGNGQRQNFIGLPIPGAEGGVLSRTYSSAGISLSTSWEPDVWGRVAAGKMAAVQDLAALEADLRAAKLSLVAQISKAWFAVLESLEQIRLSERTVASYQKTADRVRGRYEKGLQSSLDLRLSLSSLHGAQALLEQRRQQLDVGKRQLEILLGEYPAAALEAIGVLPVLPPTPPTGIPSELVSRRPDLVSAERMMWAAGARWTQARLALYPSFSISGSLGTSSSDWFQILNGNFFVWNLAGNILQPIFQGGRLKAQIRVEDARSKEAAASWANNVLMAFSEVEVALSAERFLAQRESELEKAARQSTASLRLAENRYDSGLEGFVTVLESQRRSLESESQLLTIKRSRLDNRVDLHLALGGGFDENPDLDLPSMNHVRKEGDS
jgi:NodT family efflux transporter outer membrane factor (OMF) lipoprotein